MRSCEDQRGMVSLNVMLCGAELRVVPRPPSRRMIFQGFGLFIFKREVNGRKARYFRRDVKIG